MPTYLSPGLYIREIDKSHYLPGAAGTIVGMVGTATKGPMNTKTLITTREEFMDIFGFPIVPDPVGGDPWNWHAGIHESLYSYAGFAALAALRTVRQLYFVRVGDGTEAAATNTVTTDGGSGPLALTLTAATNGTHGNNVVVELSPPGNGKPDPKLVGSEYVHYGYRKVRILYYGAVVETFDNVEIKGGIANGDLDGRAGFEDIASDYVLFTWANPTQPLASFPGGTVAVQYTLSGGLDGVNGDNSGTPLFNATVYTHGSPTGLGTGGLQLFSNPAELYVSVLAVPGVWNPSVESEMRSICAETRKDCMYVFDTPKDIIDDLGLAALVDWKQGDVYDSLAGHLTEYPPLVGASGTDGSYGAIYSPWVEEASDFAVYHGARANAAAYVPSTGYALQAMGRSDILAEPWFAPAGWTRGKLDGAIGLKNVFTRGQMDQLYTYGQINPLLQSPGLGMAIYGQRTMTATTSALDRINVRRLLLEIRRAIADSVQFLNFEPNDFITRRQFVDIINPYLADIAARRGLEDYRVKCDEENNPPAVRNRYELHGALYLIPVKAAEILVVDFILLPSGASFEEAIQAGTA